MTITIYHNPCCSKSRESLQILEASGITPDIVEYLLEPPDAQTILRLAALLGVPVADLLRRGEAEFKAATDRPQLDSDAELAAWIEKNPKVLRRPIVVDEDQGIAVIGRPAENVLQLVGK